MPQGRLRGWIIAFMLLWVPSALGQQMQITPGKGPVLITADQVTYDRDLGVVVASGHVEVSQGERVLTANTLTYNERTKTVSASGDVALMELVLDTLEICAVPGVGQLVENGHRVTRSGEPPHEM